MNQAFSIATRESVGNLHIALGGEFNGMCAWELLKAIRRHNAGSGRVFVNTVGLRKEDMARMVTDNLDKAGLETQLKDVTETTVENLTEDHDLVLLGCPAYGYEEVELQEYFAEFYDQMTGIELKGKKFAVFAPGDSAYEHFCGSVDMLEEKMIELGGTKVVDGLKIDGEPDEFEEEISEWIESAVKTA